MLLEMWKEFWWQSLPTSLFACMQSLNFEHFVCTIADLLLKWKKKRSIIIERAVKWKLFLSPYLLLLISKNCVYHCILTLFRLFNTCNTRFYEKLIFDKRWRYMYFREESIDPWYELNASETLNYWIEETFKFHGLMHEDNGILITNSTCSWTLSDASVFKVPVPWGLWNLEVSLNVHLA